MWASELLLVQLWVFGLGLWLASRLAWGQRLVWLSLLVLALRLGWGLRLQLEMEKAKVRVILQVAC
jgi:hypothetical protein